MLNRKEFSDFSSSLGSLCFADNIVLALARALKTGSLREQDEGLLKSADAFFSDVISGYGWSDNPTISQDSVQSAAAFTDAVNAIAIEAERPAEFLKHVERLRATAQQLYKERKASEKDVRLLQGFFTAYGYSQLDRADQVANRKDKYEARSWLTGPV